MYYYSRNFLRGPEDGFGGQSPSQSTRRVPASQVMYAQSASTGGYVSGRCFSRAAFPSEDLGAHGAAINVTTTRDFGHVRRPY